MGQRARLLRHDVPGTMSAILLEVAAEFGVGHTLVLAGTSVDLSALTAPDTRVAVHDHERMLANCLRHSGDPGIALHFGSRIPVVALGVLGYALMCCRNLRELIEILARYHRLISGSLHIDVQDDGAEVSLRLLDHAAGEAVQPLDCEVFFAAAAASLRQLCLVTEGALRAEFAYPEPPHGGLYRRLVCGEIRFEATVNRLVIDRSVLDLPLQFANPTLLRLYRQQCEDTLAATRRSAQFTTEVRRWLLGTPGSFPGFEAAAAVLHVSPRTLRRRLEEEGTTYQRIVHELRRQIAETYLRDSMMSVTEIAEMLGYTDISNFRRAFVGWTGHSPAGYRRSARRGAGGL